MLTTDRPLDIGTATTLATVLGWAQRNARITWAADGLVPARLIEGTARSIGDENGNFEFDEDVRDLYLRVSGTFEFFLPIEDVLVWVRNGLMAEAF
jgi:hypothetical protein